MMSTRFRMIGVVLSVVALSALEAYQWDAGPVNKAKIKACIGGSASFPWNIVTGPGETMTNLNWWFQAPGQDDMTQIATYTKNHFYATDDTRVGFLPNAGLSLRYARPQDSGDYSVQVNLEHAHSSLDSSVWRTVTLSVTDRPPATQDGALYVTLSDAVRDDVTEDWTLQLHCGQFVEFGQPPVDVVWKTPSGEVKKSSYQDNGTFVLSVSSPVQGGNYSCQLPPSATAARCLTATSPLNAAAELYVEDKDVSLSLLEARQRELVSLHQDLTVVLTNVTSQMSGLNEKMDYFLDNPNELMKKRTFSNCEDWLAVDPRNGIRPIHVKRESITVYCDQTTDNGGWIVFQRRSDKSVDFYRGWQDYRKGFGDLDGNFWLGLDKIYSLTNARRYELRVDLRRWDGKKGSATYSGFSVKDVVHNFALQFDKFTGGNAGDSLSIHRGQQFSTKEKDHDAMSGNCAKGYHGAWWYKSCHDSNLNGYYKPSSSAPYHDGMNWKTFGGGVTSYSMKFAEMKIRPM